MKELNIDLYPVVKTTSLKEFWSTTRVYSYQCSFDLSGGRSLINVSNSGLQLFSKDLSTNLAERAIFPQGIWV